MMCADFRYVTKERASGSCKADGAYAYETECVHGKVYRSLDDMMTISKVHSAQ
jgi:hypothetical protein